MWGRKDAVRALDMAQAGDAWRMAHEALCTERWTEAKQALDRIERAVLGLQEARLTAATALASVRGSWMGPTITALGALVILLFTAVGALGFYIATHGQG